MGRVAAALVTLTLTLGFASAAGAVSIAPGSYIRLYDSYGTTSGGEFNLDVVGSPAGFDAIVFCLETNEFMSFGQVLLVDDISTEARLGGTGGGSPDPISYETAYLFTQFSLGTLSSYDFAGPSPLRTPDANSLQTAIWFLENELGATTLAQLDAQAKAWVIEAQNANWSSLGKVRVLNLKRQAGDGSFSVFAQDQLYYDPTIPEPGAVGVFSTALLVAGGLIARLRKPS